MATHGTIGEFNIAQEDWLQAYVERLQQYFTANDVDNAEKQRAILLSSVGASTYQLIRNLLAPAKPTDHTLKEIVEAVQAHHQPRPSVIVQRYNFHSRSRRSDESISAFIAELRKLSEHCEFGDTLNDMLRDRLVCGINDQRIQRRLLAESDLTFQKAMDLARAAEAAEKNARQLERTTPNRVHKLTDRPKEGGARHTLTAAQCYRCGGRHPADKCKYKESDCHHCGKKGHLAKVCRSKQRKDSSRPARNQTSRSRSTHHVTEDTDEAEDETYSLFHLPGAKPSPIIVTMQVNKATLPMEVDTGASASIISNETYRTLWAEAERPHLTPSSRKLRTYTKEELTVLGSLDVDVVYGEQRETLPLLVVDGNGPSLLGRDWLVRVRLDWQRLGLYHLQAAPPTTLQQVLTKHKAVFRNELGLVDGMTAKIHVDPSTQPRFCKARTVPYALRSRVDQELERLESAGVLKPVQFSNWAAPIVPVMKRDGSVRVCGDYKVTVNQAAKPDTYPLPRIDDLFTALTGGKLFSKLDLAHAYQQIKLDDASRELVTINTQKGLFQYTRLPFGVSAAPAIFQRTIEGILRGIPHVCVYLDDILVTGKTKEHLQTLDTVLTRLEVAGLRLKEKKCSFMLESVEYLGHNISAEGLRPTKEKVRAITDAPPPTDVSQLRAFLGLINYYGKFLTNLSSTLAPLYQLLEKQQRWVWGPQQKKAFQEAKTQLTSSHLLVHYDPQQELILSCDASPYGVGTVLSHLYSDGSERPIAFASKTLSVAERKYSQLEKEGLAIVFGVKKFHDYLFGRKFQIRSDHKPLQHLFNEHRPIPLQASARIQRWALTLSAYDYIISYKPGNEHANADSLSRLPLDESLKDPPQPAELVFLMDTLQASPVTPQNIRQWTNRDPLLAKVRDQILEGWRDGEEDDMKPFNRKRDELSVQDGCILWGSRVVVPKKGREQVLELLHQSHPGRARMKSLARSIVWWPQIDADIDAMVQNCHQCQENQKAPPKSPLQPWNWPDQPWSCLHIDHAGPFMGKTFLLVVDAHSKWLEAVIVPSTSTHITVQRLRTMFATHGLPEIIVSDNATCFTSTEFQEFLSRNGIRHITSAPYHPATNGLVERAVQTFKEAMKKATQGDIETNLARFLSHYRNTPHSTTGISPAELLLKRKPRSHLSIIKPKTASRIITKQLQQKVGHDYRAKQREISVGDSVFVRNISSAGPTWLPGIVMESRGPLTFHIEMEDGRIFRRHIDHIRHRTCTTTTTAQNEGDEEDFLPLTVNNPILQATPNENVQDHIDPPRRSTRTRNPPDRLMRIDYVSTKKGGM